MTNGISVPFKSSGKTGTMIETATTARSAMAFMESARSCGDALIGANMMRRAVGLKGKLGRMFADCDDDELNDIYDSYSKEIDKTEE